MRTIQRGSRYSEQKYFGCYRGHVVDNDDPKKIGRIVLQVPEIFGLEWKTDWAQPKQGWLSAKYDKNGMEPAHSDGRDAYRRTPDIGGDKGDFQLPDIRDGVWVEFEAGDPCRPLWSGRWWAEPEGKAEPPKLAREVADETQKRDKSTLLQEVVPDVNYESGIDKYKARKVLAFPKGTDRFVSGRLVGMADTEWPGECPKKPELGEWPDRPLIKPFLEEVQEPKISFRPTYPNNRVIKTKRGTVIEIEDTWDEEKAQPHVRIHVWHPSKSWQEYHPDGTKTERVAARNYLCIEGDNDLHVKGNWNTCVEGDATLRVKGDLHTFVQGNRYTRIEGDDVCFVKGNQETFIEKDQHYRVCANQKEWTDVDQSTWVGEDQNIHVARNRQMYVHEFHQVDIAGTQQITITQDDRLKVEGFRQVSVTDDYFVLVGGSHSTSVVYNNLVHVENNFITNVNGDYRCYSTLEYKVDSATKSATREAAVTIEDKCGTILHGV